MYTKNQLSQAVADFLANNPYDVAEAIGYAGTVSTDIGVKPIYCHPVILLRSVVGEIMRISFMILTNSSTSFTKDTFITFMKSHDLARFIVSGYFVDENGDKGIVAYAIGSNNGIEFVYTVEGSINIKSQYITNLINDESTTLYDGVNRIN